MVVVVILRGVWLGFETDDASLHFRTGMCRVDDCKGGWPITDDDGRWWAMVGDGGPWRAVICDGWAVQRGTWVLGYLDWYLSAWALGMYVCVRGYVWLMFVVRTHIPSLYYVLYCTVCLYVCPQHPNPTPTPQPPNTLVSQC